MTKEQLRNYRALKKEHTRLEQRLARMEKRPECDQETLRPLKELYQAKLEDLVGAVLAIEGAIETLEPLERELVRLRYIDGLPWFKVQAAINSSEQQTHRIHSRVLQKLKNL